MASAIHRKYKYVCHVSQKQRVSCTYCENVQILFRDWFNHLKTVHSVDVRLTCPCCTGNVKWKRGEATKRLFIARHRLDCLQKFINKHRTTDPEETAVDPSENRLGPTRCPAYPEALDETLDTAEPDGSPCSCIEFFMHGRQPDMRGRTRQPEWGSFYDPYGDSTIFDVDQGTKHVKFLETSGLGSSIYNVFYYYFTEQYTFFHVMVRVRLWDACKSRRFLPRGQLHVLPFWCLCDGGHTGQEGEHDHRHMIWMMEKQHVSTFQKNWNGLNGPVNTGPNKLHILIKDANHLMNAVFYVSNPKSTCDGTGKQGKSFVGSHYWIAREVYPHAKLAMGLLWRDGQIKHVANACQHKSIDSFFDHLQKKPLRVQLKYMNLTVRNCPIPFAKEHAPQCCADGRAPLAIIFKYGVPHEMVEVPASQQLTLDERSGAEWFELQKRRNNLYWNAVEDHYYECSQSQQKAVYSAMRLEVKWSEQHKNDLDRERCESHGWKTKYQDLCGEIQAMQDVKENFREREKQFETREKQFETREKQFVTREKQFETREKQFVTREKQFENELKDLRESLCSKHLEEKLELQEVIRTLTSKNNELQNRLDEVQQVRIQQYEERLVDMKRDYEERLADMKKKLEMMENTVQSMAQRSVLYIPKYDQG